MPTPSARRWNRLVLNSKAKRLTSSEQASCRLLPAGTCDAGQYSRLMVVRQTLSFFFNISSRRGRKPSPQARSCSMMGMRLRPRSVSAYSVCFTTGSITVRYTTKFQYISLLRPSSASPPSSATGSRATPAPRFASAATAATAPQATSACSTRMAVNCSLIKRVLSAKPTVPNGTIILVFNQIIPQG